MIVRAILLAVTVFLVAVVVEIELLDLKSNGTIAAKASQEPNSKWMNRVGSMVHRGFYAKSDLEIMSELSDKQEGQPDEKLRQFKPRAKDRLKGGGGRALTSGCLTFADPRVFGRLIRIMLRLD